MKLNKEYKELTSDILDSDIFKALKNDNHHGTNRYDHCKRVSYLSFLISKLFKANYKEATEAGLLHDFFYGKTGKNNKISYLNHPKTSADNAKKYFNISDTEASIIETHMYHHALLKKVMPFISNEKVEKAKDYKPTSKEGYIVCISDLLVSIFEVGCFKIRYSACLYFLFVFNLFR